MQKNSCRAWLMLMALLAMAGLALSQSGQENATLFVIGQQGQATVIQMNGRSYVDLESLARLLNGSLSYAGNRIALALPSSATNAPATAPPTIQPVNQPASKPVNQPANPGFSKEFVSAGIEEMSTIREWRSAIANAIQNSYPIGPSSFTGYSAEAAKNLRLASLAASTDSDRSAFQLLSNELDNMQMLSDKVLAKSKAMEYMHPDYLNNNSLNQKILSCAHSLASMAATSQFVDDGSCH
jgi:hypothetical protein